MGQSPRRMWLRSVLVFWGEIARMLLYIYEINVYLFIILIFMAGLAALIEDPK
jgi:hypothetical protein